MIRQAVGQQGSPTWDSAAQSMRERRPSADSDAGSGTAIKSGGVRLTGELGIGLRLCMHLRTAGRVLVELASRQCRDTNELYALARDVPWEQHLDAKTTFAISARGGHRGITDHRFAAVRVKDAVADRFRDRYGVRPDVDATDPQMHVFLYLHHDAATLYVDLSRTGLHQRGYRRQSTAAPLRENLAAGALLIAGWDAVVLPDGDLGGERPADASPAPPILVDPMCGSGTIAIEGAMMACRIAPGLLRKAPIAERWLEFDGTLWRRVREEATDMAAEGRSEWHRRGGRIWASDIDPTAVEAARQNAALAGVDREIHIDSADFFRLPAKAVLAGRKAAGPGAVDHTAFLVTNPPYGKRVAGVGGGGRPASSVGIDFFERFGGVLSERYRGFTAGVFAPDRDQAKALGLRADAATTLLNGPIEVTFARIALKEDNRFRSRQDRIAARGPTEGIQALENRLHKNRRELAEAGIDEDVGPYRIYDADIPQHSAAIDVYPLLDSGGAYKNYMVIQEYRAPKHISPGDAATRFNEIVEAVKEVFGPGQGNIVQKRRIRQRGRRQYQRTTDGPSIIGSTNEGDHVFEVNLTDYIDTGIFPDNRMVRRVLAEMSEGGRFLNLFAYTGTADVYALAAGAETATSVDTSNVYLEWGTRNMALNELSSSRRRAVREEVIRFLEQDKGSYDVIFADPPSFSNSKSRESFFDVQRDHARLLHLARARLSSDGILVFSANLRGFRLDPSLANSFEIRDIADNTLAPDFARSKSRSRHHVWMLFPLGKGAPAQ